jgi:hypothetical protein
MSFAAWRHELAVYMPRALSFVGWRRARALRSRLIDLRFVEYLTRLGTS